MTLTNILPEDDDLMLWMRETLNVSVEILDLVSQAELDPLKVSSDEGTTRWLSPSSHK